MNWYEFFIEGLIFFLRFVLYLITVFILGVIARSSWEVFLSGFTFLGTM